MFFIGKKRDKQNKILLVTILSLIFFKPSFVFAQTVSPTITQEPSFSPSATPTISPIPVTNTPVIIVVSVTPTPTFFPTTPLTPKPTTNTLKPTLPKSTSTPKPTPTTIIDEIVVPEATQSSRVSGTSQVVITFALIISGLILLILSYFQRRERKRKRPII